MAAIVENPPVMETSIHEPKNEEEMVVVPPSFHQLAQDWNKYFVEVGDWLVR